MKKWNYLFSGAGIFFLLCCSVANSEPSGASAAAGVPGSGTGGAGGGITSLGTNDAYGRALGQLSATAMTTCNLAGIQLQQGMSQMVNAVVALGSTTSAGGAGSGSSGLMTAGLSVCPYAAGVTLQTSCPTGMPPGMGGNQPLTCEMADNPAFLNNFLFSLSQNWCASLCQDNQAQLLPQVMACAKAIAQDIHNMANSFGPQITQLFTKFQQNDLGYDTTLKEIDAQLQMATQKIQDMRKAKDALAQSVTKVSQQVEAARASLLNQDQLQKNLQTAENVVKTGVMMECFNSASMLGGKGYQCVWNGPRVSPAEFMQCRIQQQAQLKGNVILRNQTVMNQASSERGGAQNVLQGLMDNSSKAADFPTDIEGLKAFSAQSSLTMTAEQAAQQYGQAFSGMNLGGVDGADFFNQVMKACESKAENRIRKNLAVQNLKTQIQTQTAAALTKVRETNDEAVNAYSESMRSLSTSTSQTLPTLDRCQTSTPNAKNPSLSSSQQSSLLGCLNKNLDSMRALQNGSGGNIPISLPALQNVSTQNMTGYKPSPITDKCSNMTECIQKLENIATKDLPTRKTAVTQDRINLHMKQHAELLSIYQKQARPMSSLSGMLQNVIQQYNQAALKLQVPPLNAKPYPETNTGADKTKVPEQPADIGAAIGGSSTPQLLNPDTLSGGGGNRQSNTAMLHSQLMQGLSLKDNCTRQEMNRSAEAVAQQLMSAENCHAQRKYCTGDKWTELQRAYSAVSTNPRIDASTMASLSTGFSNLCEQSEELRQPRPPRGGKPNENLYMRDPTLWDAANGKFTTLGEKQWDAQTKKWQDYKTELREFENRGHTSRNCTMATSSLLDFSKKYPSVSEAANSGSFSSSARK